MKARFEEAKTEAPAKALDRAEPKRAKAALAAEAATDEE